MSSNSSFFAQNPVNMPVESDRNQNYLTLRRDGTELHLPDISTSPIVRN